MLDNVALQSGFFFALATTIFTFLHWALAAVNGLRIERVGILYSAYKDIYKKSINSVEIVLGWIPLGSFVKIAGMIDESLDENMKQAPKDYEFRGRPFLTKCIIILSSPFLLIFIGTVSLNLTSGYS